MGMEYKIVNVERKLLNKVTCDRCGNEIEKLSDGGWNEFGEPYSNLFEPHFQEFFLLAKSWGYDSKKDGDKHQAVVCEPCYDLIFKDVRLEITGSDGW